MLYTIRIFIFLVLCFFYFVLEFFVVSPIWYALHEHSRWYTTQQWCSTLSLLLSKDSIFSVFHIITSFTLLLVKCSVSLINILLKFLLVDENGGSTMNAFLASNDWSGIIVCTGISSKRQQILVHPVMMPYGWTNSCCLFRHAHVQMEFDVVVSAKPFCISAMLMIHIYAKRKSNSQFRQIVGWVFVYKLSGCGFEYRSSHLNYKYVIQTTWFLL